MTDTYLASLRDDLRTCVRDNNAAHVDSVGRVMLDGQTRMARSRLALVKAVIDEAACGYPGLGLVKTHEPGCRDIIEHSARIRERSVKLELPVNSSVLEGVGM